MSVPLPIAPEITNLPPQLWVGMHLQMSLAQDQTRILWQQFMPRREEIQHRINQELISMQVYPAQLNADTFHVDTVFEKWACVVVSKLESLPKGMASFSFPGGKYARFIHKGPSHTFPQTLAYLFGTWLPQSGFELDQRPHFEIMGSDYLGPEHPEAEEAAFLPIR